MYKELPEWQKWNKLEYPLPSKKNYVENSGGRQDPKL
jgi:hypothetical protein